MADDVAIDMADRAARRAQYEFAPGPLIDQYVKMLRGISRPLAPAAPRQTFAPTTQSAAL